MESFNKTEKLLTFMCVVVFFMGLLLGFFIGKSSSDDILVEHIEKQAVRTYKKKWEKELKEDLARLRVNIGKHRSKALSSKND